MHFKVPVDLFKLAVLLQGLFQLVQHYQMSVNVSAVMVQGVLVEISQNDVANLPVITVQMSVAPALPRTLQVSRLAPLS